MECRLHDDSDTWFPLICPVITFCCVISTHREPHSKNPDPLLAYVRSLSIWTEIPSKIITTPAFTDSNKWEQFSGHYTFYARQTKLFKCSQCNVHKWNCFCRLWRQCNMYKCQFHDEYKWMPISWWRWYHPASAHTHDYDMLVYKCLQTVP